MSHRRYPSYPDDADYTTNSPSYYDELARKEGLFRELAERIWGYEATLKLSKEEIEKRFIEWDLQIAGFDGDVNELLQKWMLDGTFDHIINETIFALKADQSEVDTIKYKWTTTKSYEELVVNGDWSIAILQAYNDTLEGGTLFIHEMLTTTKTLVVDKAIQIVTPHAEEDPLKSGGFKKMANVPTMQIIKRGVKLVNFHATSGLKDLGDIANGIEIGNDLIQAQNVVFENVYATNNGGDGIRLLNANNCNLDFSVINNGGIGFNMQPNEAFNCSGNIINCRNAFGNGDGVSLAGEGNEFYIVSQSNVGDNIQLSSYCANNKLLGYTEYAVNGYEINAKGNAYANTIMGAYRNDDPLKVYNSVTGFTNYLMFSWDLNNAATGANINSVSSNFFGHEFHFTNDGFGGIPTSLGHLKVASGEVIFNDKPLAYTGKREMNFLTDAINTIESTSGEVQLNDNFNNFKQDILIHKGGVLEGLEININKAVTTDNLSFTLYKNDGYVYDVAFNNDGVKNKYSPLNTTVIEGDIITIKATWFNSTMPTSIQANARVFVK